MICAARRFSSCVVTAIVMLAFALFAAVTPAQAHSQLLSTDPFDTEQAERAPEYITLTFNEDIVPMGSAVEVLGPDGSVISVGDVAIAGPVVTQALADVRPKGVYQVSWRVVSADGHPISGEFMFTASATFPEETEEEATSEEASTDGEGAGEQTTVDATEAEATGQESTDEEATGQEVTDQQNPTEGASEGDEANDSGRNPWRTAILVVVGLGALASIVIRLVILNRKK